MLISTANAQWNSKRVNNWWSQTEASLDNIITTGLGDSTDTKFIIGSNGDTLQIRAKFYFWRGGRYVPEDSLYTIAQIAAAYQPLEATLTDIADGTITENLVNTANPWADNEVANNLTVDDAGIASTITRDSEAITIAWQSKDSSLIDATGSGKFMMGNAGSGWYAGTTQQAKDTLGISALERVMPDTLSFTWGVMDTTTVGTLPGWKVPFNITIIELSAYTDANTCTFNIEERAETTPNTAGTDVMASDLVADNDQQEQTSFSNATIDINDWLVPTISATGDVSIFSITVRYVKTN